MLARTRATCAHVEVFCGVTCAVLGLAAWVVYLFAPIHTVIALGDGYPGPYDRLHESSGRGARSQQFHPLRSYGVLADPGLPAVHAWHWLWRLPPRTSGRP